MPLTPEQVDASATPVNLALTYSPDVSPEPYRTAPHILAMQRGLLRAVQPTGRRRLMIHMPPRHSKTLTSSQWFVAWSFIRRPSTRVILAAHTSDYAAELGGNVRSLLEQIGAPYGVHIDPSSAAKDRWATTAGGTMYAVGIGKAVIGRGANLGVIDDPHKDWKEAQSETVRASTWDWYTGTFRHRVHPGGSIILCQTRWHEEDLAGHLEAEMAAGNGEAWEVLRLAAICEDPDDDPIGRKVGDPLWDDWHDALANVDDAMALLLPDTPKERSLTELYTLKGVEGPHKWQGLFQQQPSSPEGQLLKRDWWQWYRAMPEPLDWDEQLISVDTTFKEADDSDYCVLQCWGIIGARRYLLDQVRARMDYPTFRQTLRGFVAKHPSVRVKLIEDTANGPAIIADLRNEVPGLIPVHPKGSKESRVHAVAAYVEAGNVYLPDPSIADFDVLGVVEECAAFPNGAHDDIPDALAQAMLWLEGPATTSVGSYGTAWGSR